MQGFTKIDLIILIAYLSAVLFAGLHFSKREMKGKEYFKGDGTVPWWVTSVSIFATLLSPISFLSLAGNSYAGTWIMWFAQLGMLVAIPFTIRFFLPIYSKLGIDTAYHYLEIRFKSKGLRILGAVMFIIYQVGRMSIIMYLPCMVLSKLMGVNVNILIIIMGVIAIIYSYTGGLKSVLWTDFIQGAVLLVGVTFGLIYLLVHINGGMGAVMEQLANNHKFLAVDQPLFDANIFRDSIFLLIVGAGLNTMGSYVSSQDIVQRFTTTTDTKQLNKMMVANGCLSIFIATVFYLIGTGLYVFYQVQGNMLPPAAQQDQIFASWIAFELPVGVTGILLAAIYAAAQSTLSTGLNSVASSWTLDIQARINKKELSFEKQTKIGQNVSLIVGIFAIVVAIVLAHGGVKSAYEWFNGFMGLVLGILVGTFVLGAFTKVANKFGATLAFIAASCVMVYIKYFVDPAKISFWSYSIISIAVSLVVGLVASVAWAKIKGIKEEPPANTTIYGD
ncbi:MULTISPECIES: sodium:solute symporter [Peptostreptococcus]|jgi:SSS family solute:Na+ symporter|uniref:Transporter, SSS family n=1 Tax=Peptostreptococcus anaerobius TaxID=1261 RepID=A0A135YVD7_9FIRM|nr:MULTISPECIES: sodium:solute symporter [Peptostreptococcus]KXI13375.1 transporter, SSS family [Peptostreptococcus anaerobius]MBS5596734.1 sodium:solute symporter [Peptostreptococcus sp.]MDB8820967.1 sodium:solute symporter [Peptostreptococcus anaerobius]MDB8826242.1 sodium:solute symporter [Peptostreptococcus anaerobius]MDB8827318.1 sodium:solute symporter [Peptostreptococcus anaerobius]